MSDPPESVRADAETAEFERKMEEAVEAYHRLAKQTENPVYAWLALMSRGWAYQHRQLKGYPEEDLRIPAWCSTYFARTAQDVSFLADGYDLRAEPDADNPPPLLPAGTAMELLSLALGFTGRGYNAFNAFRKAKQDMQVFNRMEELRDEGNSAASSLGKLAREFGEREESVLRKRVTRGRRLRKGERPEEEKQPSDEGKT